MFRIISEVSAGPGWLPTGNMDKFMLWSSAWALSLFISLIQTQMKCRRRKLNSKMTHWRKSKWDCCRSSVYQTLYMQFQPPIQYLYIYLLLIYVYNAIINFLKWLLRCLYISFSEHSYAEIGLLEFSHR